MSHIAFDLDALPLVPKVARASSLPEGVIAWGLLQMWEWCWRGKTDAVTSIHLKGFFGADVAECLAAFGFLEQRGAAWRVKGAERYLRISKARSEAGKKSRANLRQFSGKPTGTPPAIVEQVPEQNTGSTANSDERTASSEQQKKLASREKRAPLPRETDGILEDFAAAGLGKYAWQGAKDGTAWGLLRAHSPPEEIRARWRFGLKADGWLRVATVAQLHAKWNDLGAAMKRPSSTGPPSGAASAKATDWSDYKPGDTARELFGGDT